MWAGAGVVPGRCDPVAAVRPELACGREFFVRAPANPSERSQPDAEPSGLKPVPAKIDFDSVSS